MRKISVDTSIMGAASFLSCRCIPRNSNAFPVSSGLLLTWKRMDNHVRGFGVMPSSAGIHPVSGRQLLDILSGLRAGDLSLFNS